MSNVHENKFNTIYKARAPEIERLLSIGMPKKTIAKHLRISISTLKDYIKRYQIKTDWPDAHKHRANTTDVEDE